MKESKKFMPGQVVKINIPDHVDNPSLRLFNGHIGVVEYYSDKFCRYSLKSYYGEEPIFDDVCGGTWSMEDFLYKEECIMPYEVYDETPLLCGEIGDLL